MVAASRERIHRSSARRSPSTSAREATGPSPSDMRVKRPAFQTLLAKFRPTANADSMSSLSSEMSVPMAQAFTSVNRMASAP